MTTVNIYDMAQTWNNGAVDFTAIKINVTDTASGSNSLLMDLQVGGTSKFKVDKLGNFNNDVFNVFSISNTNYISGPGSGWSLILRPSANTTRDFRIGPDGSVNFRADSTGTSLWGEAVNTLAQRNGANPQEFRLYNTYTDASNYERAHILWAGNLLTFGGSYAGTGVRRVVRFSGFAGGGDSYLQIDNNANVSFVPTNGGKTFINNFTIIRLPNLPTSDPAVAGQLWNDGGTVKVSAG